MRDKSGRCEAHPFKAGSFADKRRGTAEERGYGWEWKKLRLRILERDKYLCQVALAEGRIEPAEEVDHIIGKATWMQLHGTLDGVDDPSNLQAIGKARHAEKTRREAQRDIEP